MYKRQGLGAARDDAAGRAGLLPVLRLGDGGLGRSGVGDLHRRHLRSQIDDLPEAGSYATGLVFLPGPDDDGGTPDADAAHALIDEIVEGEGLAVHAWREVPVDASDLGQQALDVIPTIRQIVITDPEGRTGLDLDRIAYIARKRIEHETAAAGFGTYLPSLSARTFVYKGMLTTPQLSSFFPDLQHPEMASALALVHSRFSTNTFPAWPLAHPYRFVAHNGEINTVMGNRNWMRACLLYTSDAADD